MLDIPTVARSVRQEAVLACVQERMHQLVVNRLGMACFYHKLFTIQSDNDDHVLLPECLPAALRQVFPGCINLLIDGRDVSCLKDFFQFLLGGLSGHLGLAIGLAEDIEEFCESTSLDAVPTTFVACCNSSCIPAHVLESVLDILRTRMPTVNINFLLDSEKPTIDLPFYKQDRLLHYVVPLPSPAGLTDELLHKLLASGWLHLDRTLCEYLLGELFERDATFNSITQCLAFVEAHRRPVGLERHLLLSLYTVHFATHRILKQNKLLLETLCLLLQGTVDKVVCNVIQAASLQDRIATLLDVARAVPGDDKSKHLFDQCVAALHSGDTSGVDQVYRVLLACDSVPPQPGPDMVAHLRRAFSPDPHLAIQSALKHPFLYLNVHRAGEHSPASLLYRIICEQACHKPSLGRLLKQFVHLGRERSQFVPALRTLQLCGQVGPCRTGFVERLNPDDALTFSEPLEALFIKEDQ